MRNWMVAALLAIAGGSAAQAEVVSATANGFEVRAQRVVAAAPEETWAMLGRIGEWWDSSHTFSGSAANLSLKLEAGGCFCEVLPAGEGKAGGGVAHGRVVMAMPNLGLTLDSALGPLIDEGAAGKLKWSLRAVEGGTQVTQSYVVGGYVRGGPEKMAPIVDMVLTTQLDRLQQKLAR